ncbi:hypothetical protein [Vibrio sp. RE88]|uniref:hypothetical protein n=1 Tax=Vibrio sp. RE88 TaxID=2607610 RepID=UPI001493C2F3|nr:hypothetical protein [Vibrio sp. RE88]
MTLFVIGLIKIVIGIEFTTNTISIPWLPKIELAHIDKLVLIYWGIVVYAIYRYSLYNMVSFKELWFEALSNSLQPGAIGEKLVHSAIFTDDMYYEVNTKKIVDDMPHHYISLNQFADEDEVACSFDFCFDHNYKFDFIDCQINPHYSCEHFAPNITELKEKWGFYHYSGSPNGEQGYRVKHFNGFKLTLWRLAYSHYIKLLLTDKRAFDMLLPILLNCSLFVYWVTTYLTP